jgi:hypothetical protein
MRDLPLPLLPVFDLLTLLAPQRDVRASLRALYAGVLRRLR